MGWEFLVLQKKLVEIWNYMESAPIIIYTSPLTAQISCMIVLPINFSRAEQSQPRRCTAAVFCNILNNTKAINYKWQELNQFESVKLFIRIYHVLPYTHFIVSIFILWASLYSDGDSSEIFVLSAIIENPTAGTGDNTGFIL